MKKNRLGMSANERVHGCGVDCEDVIRVSNYSRDDMEQVYWGFENEIYANRLFGRNYGTIPQCWSQDGYGVKTG